MLWSSTVFPWARYIFICAVDFAIHSGPVRAIQGLQYAAHMASPHDGVLGPQTQAAVNLCDAADTHRRLLAFRLRFLAKLDAKDKSQDDFWGWYNRVANLMELPATL